MAADGGVSVGGEGEHGVDAGCQRHVGGGVHHRHQPRPRPPASSNKYSDLNQLISSRLSCLHTVGARLACVITGS